MSNTYTWKVINLKTFGSINGLENVVSSVYWKLQATDDVNIVDIDGHVELDLPMVEEFIAYDTLTEDQVIEWTKAQLGTSESEYCQYLDQMLLEAAQPPTPSPVITALPWVPVPASGE